MRGLLVLAQRMGIRAFSWRDPYESLTAGVAILWMTPVTVPSTDPAIDRWVREGGTLVYQGHPDQAPFLGQPPPALRAAPLAPPAAQARAVRGLPDVARDVRRVVISVGVRARSGTVLLADAAGPLITEHRLGAGRVVVIADSHLFTNRYLAAEDNAVLAANLLFRYAHGRSVAFDEVVHGLGGHERGPWSRLLSGNVAWGLVQIAVAAVLLALWSGSRLGPPVPLPEAERTRYAIEYVHSMASLYRRAGARQAAVRALWDRWRREIAPGLGLSATSDARTIASRLPEAHRPALQRLAELLEAGVKSDSELVEFAAGLERLRRALAAGRFGDRRSDIGYRG
jgi:hypothetical protein